MREIFVEMLQYWNCSFVTLFEYLNKNNKKNPDGLVWTIFGGRNPKVGVKHMIRLSHCIISCAGLFIFVYMMMMIMNAVQMCQLVKRLLNFLFLQTS